MQNAIINTDGQISPAQKAKVSVWDRSYLYGDSLYEVARTYQGSLFKLNEHLERLIRSAELCKMDVPAFKERLPSLKEQMLRTLEAYKASIPPSGTPSEAYLRVIVSRGRGRIGFGNECIEAPFSYCIIAQKLEEPSLAQIQEGLKLFIADRIRNHPRALDPAMKSGNYLNSVLAFLEAREAGFDDALMLNHQGHLTEGTTFNIFYIRRGIVVTPPLDIGILDGITRRITLELCRHLGLETREVRFPEERLLESDEAFITSTIKEVLPITQVGSTRIGAGTPGPFTLRLRKEFRRFALHET